jgi:hypothetical protein
MKYLPCGRNGYAMHGYAIWRMRLHYRSRRSGNNQGAVMDCSWQGTSSNKKKVHVYYCLHSMCITFWVDSRSRLLMLFSGDTAAPVVFVMQDPFNIDAGLSSVPCRIQHLTGLGSPDDRLVQQSDWQL